LFIRVAVPVPQLSLLTYLVPDGVPAPPRGARVVVPLGARAVTGVVVAHGSPAGAAGREVRPIRKVLDEDAFLPSDVIDLACWTAEYYASGVGEAIVAVLPAGSRAGRADSHKKVRLAAISDRGRDLLRESTASTLMERRRQALEILAQAEQGLSPGELAARGVGSGTVARLVRQGLASVRAARVDRNPFDNDRFGVDDIPDRELTREQDRALARLTRLAVPGTFGAVLLHGVTGSGKTELYARLASSVQASGRRSLVLVPEIALTPAVAALFRSRFGDRVAIQHSGLSDGERHDQWQRVRQGEVDAVVGTRSAVFAPLPELGLVIVDEEHDTSYKQEESPRYNGRDVAIVRAQRAGALVVLGSATPSMETYHNAMTGKYERVVLEKRVHDRPLASVTIVDMREEYAAEGPDVVIGRALRTAIATRLASREQSLVLLNRRGFATSVFCRHCAGTLDCPNCSVSLVVHGEGAARRARCHYCDFSRRVPAACQTCAAPYLEHAGFGTERIEADLGRLFPEARVARLDRDAIRRRGALDELLAAFRAGSIDILVGTQMIAKGHDFPRVTLVGVVSADVGLGLADFRASERTFQLLTQVAGRAGRGDQQGQAIVQTLYPDHYSIQLACRQDYPAFYNRELHFRRAMRYPPVVSLINTVVRASSLARALDDAMAVVGRLRGQGTRLGFRVLGPAPAPLARLRGAYRAQFLIKGSSRRRMRDALLEALAARPDVQRRATVDVDPLSVL
jgi:primosomal protein N' (replication factor Y)